MSTESVSAPSITTLDRASASKITDEALPRISAPIVLGLLSAADGAAIFGSGIAALFDTPVPALERPLGLLVLSLVGLIGMQMLWFVGAYRQTAFTHLRIRTLKLLACWTVMVGATASLFYIAGAPSAAMLHWLWLWALSSPIVLLAIQGALTLAIWQWRAAGRLTTRIAVIGTGPIAYSLLQCFEASGDARIVGVFDDQSDSRRQRCAGHSVLGDVDRLVEHVRQGWIDCVVIAIPLAEQGRLLECVAKLQSLSVDVRFCADEIGVRLGACGASQFGGVTLLNARNKPFSGWRWVMKQIEDRILAALILCAISPLMLAIGVLIRLDSAGPIFFRQKRYGLNNELIEVFKFRTMHDRDRDPNCEQQTQRNDPRVTRVGNLLRRTSLDELPQLINVVLGTMSLVGPRPHAISSKAGGVLFDDAVRFYHSRHRVKPGITGWAQVCGWRGETTSIEQIKQRVVHDVFYIEHWSIWFDLWIIARTIVGGFVGRNAY